VVALGVYTFVDRKREENKMMEGLGILYLIGVVFVIVLAIAWIILPLALIGTKPLLRQLIKEQQRTNELLGAPRETPVYLIKKAT
jgi:hypothetical protein